MSAFPLPYIVKRVARTKTRKVDELGNDVVVDSEVAEDVAVAGWGAPVGDEPKLAGHDRRTVEVELFAPVGVFTPTDAVELPDRPQRLEVIGQPGNYEHNPFGWSPGLEIVNLAGVI